MIYYKNGAGTLFQGHVTVTSYCDIAEKRIESERDMFTGLPESCNKDEANCSKRQ